MTIEAKIDETNLLLRELITLVRPATPGTVPAPSTPSPQPTPAAKPKPVKAPAAKAPEPTPPPPETTAADEDISFDEPVAETAPKLTKDDARKALVALQKAKSSPEASRKILAANKLGSLADLTDAMQEVIAKVIADCKVAMPAVPA